MRRVRKDFRVLVIVGDIKNNRTERECKKRQLKLPAVSREGCRQ